MRVFDLDNLTRDDNQDGLYNLIEQTFVLRDLPYLTTVVTKEQEMRIDLISQYLYGDVDHTDLILNLNNIDLPINIKQGDTIFYIPVDLIDNYRIKVDETTNKRRLLLSPDKANVKDPNRKSFVENDYQLPPTFLNSPENPVTSTGNRIIVNPLQ
jgi:hypothetical protein